MRHIGCICPLFKRIQKIYLEPFLKVFGPLNNFSRCFTLLATSNRHLRISQTLSQSGTNLRLILCLISFPATWLVGKSQVFVLEISCHYGRRSTPKTISQYRKPIQFDCANLGQQVFFFQCTLMYHFLNEGWGMGRGFICCNHFFPILCLKN